jgi:hypothetical protein
MEQMKMILTEEFLKAHNACKNRVENAVQTGYIGIEMSAAINRALAEKHKNYQSDINWLIVQLIKHCPTDEIKDIFENITGLTTLYLSGNQISDISALKELTGLTTLYLSRNQISDISALKELTGLTTLILSGNQISDYDLAALYSALPNTDIFN